MINSLTFCFTDKASRRFVFLAPCRGFLPVVTLECDVTRQPDISSVLKRRDVIKFSRQKFLSPQVGAFVVTTRYMLLDLMLSSSVLTRKENKRSTSCCLNSRINGLSTQERLMQNRLQLSFDITYKCYISGLREHQPLQRSSK